MVFSMPEGTDPETVKQAVRETAERMLGDNHDYLIALHTDTPRPHVHMTVEAEGLDGKRFDPRRENLFKFQETFAEALRSRGVECEATALDAGAGEAWHQHGVRPDGSGDPRDKELARELRSFLKDRPSVETVPDRVLKDAVERVRVAREQQRKEPDRSRLPDRAPPGRFDSGGRHGNLKPAGSSLLRGARTGSSRQAPLLSSPTLKKAFR